MEQKQQLLYVEKHIVFIHLLQADGLKQKQQMNILNIWLYDEDDDEVDDTLTIAEVDDEVEL